MDASSSLVRVASCGCYEARRAAALSGVPVSTIYYWARTGVVTPSVSPAREKLWSYADLMALRVVSWLRHPKASEGEALPPSPMPQVRRALAKIDELGLDLWDPTVIGRSPLVVDRAGDVHIKRGGEVRDIHDQLVIANDLLDLLGPFDGEGGNAPDLVAPRPRLRIIPARVAGEPHVADTRLTTLTLAGMAERGMTAVDIASLYDIDPVAVSDALDLERQLGTHGIAA